MNCATPTDFTFSLQGFCKRGGETDIHSDGWGVAFYQDSGLRQFQDVEPASTSHLAKFLSQYPIRTLNMMGHIRYATVGQVDSSNVHPFSREMWGIQWCFAHNGEVPMFATTAADTADTADTADGNPSRRKQLQSLGCSRQGDSLSYYHPIGTTDSEATFCAILNALRAKFQTLPSLPILYNAIQQLCSEIVLEDPDGSILNFIMTCGPHIQWVYSWPGSRPGSKVWNGLYYTVREYPFQKRTHLCDVDYEVDFSTCTTQEDRVSVIATKPLTDDEAWVELERGELLLFDQGKPHTTIRDLFQVELSGHGLNSTVMERPHLEHDMKLFHMSPHTFQGECI
jgi:glutamine amidotransferase